MSKGAKKHMAKVDVIQKKSEGIYQVSYLLGVQVLRISHRFKGVLRTVGRFVGRYLYRVWDFLVWRYVRRVIAECRRFFGGFAVAGDYLRRGFSRGIGVGLLTLFYIPYLAVRRHAAAIKTVCNFLMPLAAAVVLVFTVNYWTNCRFVMAVEYQGEYIGYVEKLSTFQEGAILANERLDSAANNAQLGDEEGGIHETLGSVNEVPRMQLTTDSRAVLVDANTICDRILHTVGDTITEMSGLYINGIFEGALSSQEALKDVLDRVLSPYVTDSVDERVEFVQNVQVVNGLYPAAALMSPTDLKKRLTAQSIVDKYYVVQAGDTLKGIARKVNMTLSELLALNPDFENVDNIYVGDKLLVQRAQPYLQVQVVRTIVYEEAIPYDTKTVKDPTQYATYERVRTSGKKGTQKVTAEVVYLDGVEQSRKVISTTVTKAPVTRVVVVGSKEINPNATKGEATGKFVWPVPGFTYISSDYYDVDEEDRGRPGIHAAIDIWARNIYGASIVASDGGTVVEAVSNHWSYGNYITIDHGGGIRTRYAHCSKLLVKKGEKVKQGQIIAKVGSTGQSTVPHLHFEVRVNGNRVNPSKYVSP